MQQCGIQGNEAERRKPRKVSPGVGTVYHSKQFQARVGVGWKSRQNLTISLTCRAALSAEGSSQL